MSAAKTTADLLLNALRERAWKRNSVRLEQRQKSQEGKLTFNEQLSSWKAYQAAEATLNEALRAWEREEGVGE